MENNQPEVRFPEFSESWNKVKLGNVFEQTTEYVNPKTRNIELWSLTVEKGLTPKTDRYNREFLVKKEDQFKAVSSNEFIYNPMNMTLGAVDLNQTGKQVAVSGYYITMKTLNGFDNDYFNIWLKSPLAIKMYKSYATGSLIEKQRVQFPTLSLIKASVPPMEEQRKIGNFFKQLDDTITLHQQELSTLKQTKQGFLQKMFPREGESVPEVRFPGFDGKWEHHKLNEVAEIIGGGTPSTNVQEYWDGDIDWYSPVEIGKDTYAFGSKRKITSLGLKKSSAKVLPANKTILFTSRAGIGDMAILKKDGATNQGFQSLVVNNNYDIYFVYSMGYKIKEFALKRASGSTFLEISGKGLGTMNLFVPSLEEQTRIGNFFKQLDGTIALHQRELDDLKETKKAFLQKMFV